MKIIDQNRGERNVTARRLVLQALILFAFVDEDAQSLSFFLAFCHDGRRVRSWLTHDEDTPPVSLLIYQYDVVKVEL